MALVNLRGLSDIITPGARTQPQPSTGVKKPERPRSRGGSKAATSSVLVRLPNSPRPFMQQQHAHSKPRWTPAQQQQAAVPPRAASQRQHPERARALLFCSAADSLPLARLRGLSAFIARAACLHPRPASAAIKRERPPRPRPAPPPRPERKPTSRRLSARAVAHARQARLAH